MIALAILAVAVIAAGFWARSCRNSAGNSTQPVIIREIVRDTIRTANNDSDALDVVGISAPNKSVQHIHSKHKSRSRKTSHRKSSTLSSSPREFLNDTIRTK